MTFFVTVGVFMADSDPLSAALKKTFNSPSGSFFPAAQKMVQNDRQDLLKETENAFYGGGQSQPTPTPTPTPTKPHQLTLEQLYDHFGVDNPVRLVGNYGRPLYQNTPDAQVYRSQYGYPS